MNQLKPRRNARLGGIRLILAAAATTAAGVGIYALASQGGGEPRSSSTNTGSSKQGTQALTADRALVRKMGFDIATTVNGELEARNRLEIRSRLENPTTVQYIIPEGTRAKPGEMLIQLNAESIQNKIDEERPRIASARAELVAAENNYNIQINDNASALRKAQLNLDLGELALLQWVEGDAVKKRQELDLEVDRASLELDRLAQRYVRSQDLLIEGFISKDECDRDEVAYISAISAFATAHKAKEVFERYEYVKQLKKLQADVDEARSELARVGLNNDIELASKDARRRNQREQVTISEARLERLEQSLASATVMAPREGLVVYGTSLERGGWNSGNGPLQIGQQVFPNQLLIILPDVSEMVAAVRVHESMAGRVRSGQPVSVRVDAAGGRVFSGRVESIGVMAEGGGWRDPNLREYTVRVALSDPGDLLKPAMRCEARIILDTVAETLTIPVQGVFSEGPVQFVYSPRGNRFARVPVRIGKRSDVIAEIRTGLKEGDVVLIREPAAGEVLNEPWNPEQLKVAGYTLDEQGQVVAEAPRGMPPGAAAAGTAPSEGAPSGGGQRRGRPAEGGAPAAAPPATGAASTPAATPTAEATGATPAAASAPAK